MSRPSQPSRWTHVLDELFLRNDERTYWQQFVDGLQFRFRPDLDDGVNRPPVPESLFTGLGCIVSLFGILAFALVIMPFVWGHL